jgi:mono/diheme cytochrome c family protein
MKPAPLVRGLAATLVLFTVAAAAVAFRSTSAAAPAAAPVASGPSKGDPALGKAIFTKNCVVCHKADGTGGVKLTGNPTPNWKDAKTWADPVRAKDDYSATASPTARSSRAWWRGARADSSSRPISRT